jgi:hypothetical protein
MSKNWKFILEEAVTINTSLRGVSFKNKYCKMQEDGSVIAKKGFAWDGCTPKWVVFDLMIGTPDGATDGSTGKPKTYYASLVHDILYQFAPRDQVTRLQADLEMLYQMEKTNFKLKKLYYRVIRLFGGKWWKKYSRK